MSKDYINNIPEAERRFFTGGRENGTEVRAEKRAEGDGYVVRGYAAKFNNVTNIMNVWEEEVLPGFFDEVMNDDVRALFNHDPNQVLARCINGVGTLSLSLDAVGLVYEFVTPKRSYAEDLADAINAGDVSESSFAFVAHKESEGGQEWVEREGRIPLRRLKRCKKLYDVSPVTYPAYAGTSVEVAQRSLGDFLKEIEQRKTDNQDPETRTENKGLSLVAAQLIINQNL